MLRVIGLIFFLNCAFVLSQGGDNNATSLSPPDIQPVTPISTTSKPFTTVNPDKTTNPTSTSTAHAPKTSSIPSLPTTTSITPTTPTSTTPAPTTPTSTSPAPTTPTPVPTSPTTTALPPPTKGHYVIHGHDNETCIIAEMAIQVKLVLNNQTSKFDVWPNSTLGDCSNDSQSIILGWKDDAGKPWSLAFYFAKNDTSRKFMVSQITLEVPQKNETLNLTNDEPVFSTSISKSYRCIKQQEIELHYGNDTHATLTVSDVQLEAFHTSGDGKFSTVEDCVDSSTDIVPIAVGCALVGLIAIVLIAFLVGRRRSQARGYLSM